MQIQGNCFYLNLGAEFQRAFTYMTICSMGGVIGLIRSHKSKHLQGLKALRIMHWKLNHKGHDWKILYQNVELTQKL